MPRFAIPAILLIHAVDAAAACASALPLCQDFVKRHDPGPNDLRGPLLRICGASEPRELPDADSHYPFTLHGYGPDAARAEQLGESLGKAEADLRLAREQRDTALAERDRFHNAFISEHRLVGLLESQLKAKDVELASARDRELQLQHMLGNAQPVDIDRAVDRFLGWKLPPDFRPDCGISFTKPVNPHPSWWPTGTNLFHAGQARAMFEHALAPATAQSASDALERAFADTVVDAEFPGDAPPPGPVYLGDFKVHQDEPVPVPLPEWNALAEAIDAAITNLSCLSPLDTIGRNVLIDHARGLCQLQREGFAKVLNPPRMFPIPLSVALAGLDLSFGAAPEVR